MGLAESGGFRVSDAPYFVALHIRATRLMLMEIMREISVMTTKGYSIQIKEGYSLGVSFYIYGDNLAATELYKTDLTRDKLGRITQKIETVSGSTRTFDYARSYALTTE